MPGSGMHDVTGVSRTDQDTLSHRYDKQQPLPCHTIGCIFLEGRAPFRSAPLPHRYLSTQLFLCHTIIVPFLRGEYLFGQPPNRSFAFSSAASTSANPVPPALLRRLTAVRGFKAS